MAVVVSNRCCGCGGSERVRAEPPQATNAAASISTAVKTIAPGHGDGHAGWLTVGRISSWTSKTQDVGAVPASKLPQT